MTDVQGQETLNYIVFDNKGETLDRYTLVVQEEDDTTSCYGFNGNPYHPLGIGQYIGDFLDYEEVRANSSNSHLGIVLETNDEEVEVDIDNKDAEITSPMRLFIDERIIIDSIK